MPPKILRYPISCCYYC